MSICVKAHIFVFAATAALLLIRMLYRSSPKGSTNVLVLLFATLALAQSSNRIPLPRSPACSLPRLHLHTHNAKKALGQTDASIAPIFGLDRP